MESSATVSALGAMAQALGRDESRRAFVDQLGHVVTALGAIPDSPPVDFTVGDRNRLREIVDAVVETVERRIDEDTDNDSVKQHLASTIYEIRRRMEVIEGWFTHAFPGL
jgi:hypothetical protein